MSFMFDCFFLLKSFPFVSIDLKEIRYCSPLIFNVYHLEEFHIVAVGSNRKITYWETFDGSQLRELEASKSAKINGLDVETYGDLFVTASSDNLV